MMHTIDNVTTLVFADRQGKYFNGHFEKHRILSLLNSGDKIEDLFPKYQDNILSFAIIIILTWSNNCSSWNKKGTMLTKMQQLFEEINRETNKSSDI